MRGSRSRALRAAAVSLGLCALAAGLWRAGDGTLALPPLDWDRATIWYDALGPEAATIALVRGVALLLTLWLLAAVLAEGVAHLVGGVMTRRVADLVAPRSLQRAARGLAGLSLTAGLAVSAPGAGTPTDGPAAVAVLRLAEEAPPPTAAIRVLDEAEPAQPVPVPASVPVPAPAASPVAVVVAPGDCFWSIAERLVASELGRAPRDDEVVEHWRELIAANRARLVDPGNPDLLYPGQQLVVPAR